jgi:hypothetical protein
MLALLQLEAHHRQRIDGVWTQFKDTMLVIHGAVFALLATMVTVPGLDASGRIGVVAFAVILDMMFLIPARRDVERSAAEMEADYAADYRALTGKEPPRRLYSRALKRRKERPTGGASILAPRVRDEDDA